MSALWRVFFFFYPELLVTSVHQYKVESKSIRSAWLESQLQLVYWDMEKKRSYVDRFFGINTKIINSRTLIGTDKIGLDRAVAFY